MANIDLSVNISTTADKALSHYLASREDATKDPNIVSLPLTTGYNLYYYRREGYWSYRDFNVGCLEGLFSSSTVSEEDKAALRNFINGAVAEGWLKADIQYYGVNE